MTGLVVALPGLSWSNMNSCVMDDVGHMLMMTRPTVSKDKVDRLSPHDSCMAKNLRLAGMKGHAFGLVLCHPSEGFKMSISGGDLMQLDRTARIVVGTRCSAIREAF